MRMSLNAPIGHLPMNYGFELDEAYDLLNLTVVEAAQTCSKPTITNLGLICGVLTVNDEIELVIKFMTELRQYTREEFMAQLTIVKD